MKRGAKPYAIAAILTFVLLSMSCYGIPKESFLITSHNTFAVQTVSADACYAVKDAVDTALDPASIKIISWNIREGNRTTLFKNWRGDRESWKRDFLHLSKESDVIFLQEVYLDQENKDNFDELEKEKKRALWWAASESFIYKKNDIGTGVMTISVAEPFIISVIRQIEPYLRTPKTFLLTKYKLKGFSKELLAGNIHGILVGLESFIEQVENLKKQIGEHDGPVIIAGDFNTYNKKRIQELEKIRKELQLESVFGGYDDTDNRSERNGYPVDHIFYRDLQLKAEPHVEKVRTSDHNCIQAEFKLSE